MTAMNGEAAEVEAATCDCCGLTEECTPEYIAVVRAGHGGRWVCGLCSEAVEDEIRRSDRPISIEEAFTRHSSFRESFRSPPAAPPPNPADLLIAAVRQLLRRSLDSPRSTPGSPQRRVRAAAEVAPPPPALAAPGSCLSSLAR